MENPNAPPPNAQAYTNEAPSSLPAGFASMPKGAREFIREYLPDDDSKDCIVSFEIVQEYKPFKTEKNREAAVAAGREPDASCEVYEPVVYVRKRIRGNDKIEVHKPADANDKRQFPFAYQEFMRGNQSARGTPLTQIGLDAGIIRRCESVNVQCVEDLALVIDTNLNNIGTGAREMRRKAIEFLQKNAPVDTGLKKEVLQLKEENAKTQALLKQAMEIIAEQKKDLQKKKPGRKPKVQNVPTDDLPGSV